MYRSIDKYTITDNVNVEYIGVNPTDTLNAEDHHIFYAWYYPYSKETVTKIGETAVVAGLTPEACVNNCFSHYSSRGQDTEFFCENIYVVPRKVDGRKWTDKRFHRYLKTCGIKKHNKIQNNEFYRIKHADVAVHLRRNLTGQDKELRGLNTIQLRVLEECKAHIENTTSDHVHIVADLCARFGKTMWSLELIKEVSELLGLRIAILPSYWLSTHSSVSKEINTLSNFSNMKFIDTKDCDEEEWVSEINHCFKTGKFPIVGISLCGDDEADKFKHLNSIPASSKFVFIDEADFGSHTDKSKKILEKVIGDDNTGGLWSDITSTNGKLVVVSSSGTGIKKYASSLGNLKTITHHVSVPYLELVQNKATDSSLSYIPDVSFLKLFIEHKFANELKEIAGIDNLPNWTKVLKDVNRSKLFLESTFKSLFVKPYMPNGMYLPHIIDEMQGNIVDKRAYMLFVGTNDKGQLIKLSEIIRSTVGEDYIVEVLCGSTTNHKGTTNEEAESLIAHTINDAKANGKSVIVLSMGMGSRSFSIPEIDTVLLLKDGGMVIQPSSRCLTGGNHMNGEKKEKGTIIHLGFDQNRDQDALAQIILPQILQFKENEEQRTGEEQQLEQIYLDVHKSLDIWSMNDNDCLMGISPEESWEEFSKGVSILDVIQSSIDFEGIMHDEVAIRNIIKATIVKKAKIEKVKKLLEKGGSLIPTDDDNVDITDVELTPTEVSKVDNQVKIQMKLVVDKSDTLMYAFTIIADMTNYTTDITTAVNNISTNKELAEEFEFMIGVDIRAYKEIIRKYFPQELMEIGYNQYIKDVEY